MLKTGPLIFVICIVGFLLLPINAKSEGPDVMLLRVESGGSIHFSVNSLIKYQEGLAFESWTRLGIAFEDSDLPGRTWRLEFRAKTDSIIGDYGRNMALEYLTLEAVDGGGNVTLGVAGNGDFEDGVILSNAYQPLFINGPQGTFQDNKILISYRLGKGAEKLMGNPFGFYFVDIEFRIFPD